MFSMKKDVDLFFTIERWIKEEQNHKVKFIIEHSEPTELVGADDLTLLHIAALHGNLHMMEYFTKMGCDIDAQDIKNRTPLMSTVTNEHWTAAKFLLERNADVFACDSHGNTPLTIFMRVDTTDSEIIQIFFDKVKNECTDKKGMVSKLIEYGCPLYKIIHLHDAEVTEIFLNTLGADVYEEGLMPQSVDFAMRSMDEENLKVLLHHGIAVERRRQLFLLIVQNVMREHSHSDQSVAELLALFVKWLTDWKLLDNVGAIRLMGTFIVEAPEATLRILLDEALVSYIKNDFGYDIRMYLFGNEDCSVFAMIRNGEADMYGRARKGRTALHIATRYDVLNTMQYLLERGLSPNITDDDGKTPLFEVDYLCGSSESLALLLHYGADLQATDNSGNTYVDYWPSPGEIIVNIFISHLAILKTAGVPIKQSFCNFISSCPENEDRFRECCEQLETMKKQTVHISLTLFDALTENQENLLRRTSSLDPETVDFIIEKYFGEDYDYYASTSCDRLDWAVSINESREKAMAAICDSIQVLKPYYVVVEKICSFLSYYDLRAFE